MVRKRMKLLCFIVVAIILACMAYMLVYERYEKRLAMSKYHGEAVPEESDIKEAERIAELYYDIYEKAVETDSLDSVEVMRQIIERLGTNGYTAVDGDNQIDMANAERAEQFLRQQEAGEEGELTIIRFLYCDGFVKYDMKTENGKVSVARGYYEYQDGSLKNGSFDRYDADFWEYTEEGYLLFEGELFSEEQYALTMSVVSEHVAMRVKPLSRKCRELNRQYILPVGYGRNNLFLLDWNEEDFGEIDFQDMFDILYPLVYGKNNPYAEKSIGTGAVTHVPEEEFEYVIQSYFNIESEVLQEKAPYYPKEKCYGFRTRGMSELEFSELPYPEVVNYAENRDGTITLTVNVVYPDENCAKAYSHEVTIRPKNGASVQYVSNHIIPSENNDVGSWHKDRAAEEEVKEESTGSEKKESSLWVLPQAEKSLLTEEEKKKLQDLALKAGEQVKNVYRDVEIMEGPSYGSNIREFTDSQRAEAAMLLGKAGFTSITEDQNMENPERLEEFYSAYEKKQDTQATIVRINRDGLLGVITFIYRNGQLQTYYVGVRWLEGGIPQLSDTSVSDVSEIRLTDKGYFIYAYKVMVAHAALRQYFRVKPLSDKCRELTEKYVSHLSYVNYNMLVRNWDAGNVEEILMPGLFEDLYRMNTGEGFQAVNGRIPADQFERIMTAYLPVSAEQLRSVYGYEAGSNSYLYEPVSPKAHPPFGEVVSYREYPDGKLLLVVDGVWADYNSDCAFTNQIVIQTYADGSFRYLSNSIEQKELELPPVANALPHS